MDPFGNPRAIAQKGKFSYKPWFPGFLSSALFLLLCFLQSVVRLDAGGKMEEEQLNYNLHCLGCHGVNGMGITDVPRFPGVLGYFVHIQEGREFIIQVPGVSHSDLSDAEIARLTNWTLKKFSPKELPTDFRPYTPEEVSEYRKNPVIDVDRRRKEVIRLLQARGVPVPES